MAIDLVEHIARELLLRFGQVRSAALRDGGRFVVQTPNWAGLLPGQVVYGDLTHVTIFDPGSLQQWLELCGFERCSFRETGPVAKSASGALRWGIWQVVRLAANALRAVEAGKRQAIWTENMIACCFRAPHAPR